MNGRQKVVIIGTGFVGTSLAFALLSKGISDEIILIDINKEKAEGEALDLMHASAFSKKNIFIRNGDYSDCKNAKIVVITAGSAQKEGESRIDLLNKNAKIAKGIVKEIKKSEFNGIYLIATNPVDIISKIIFDEANVSENLVIGSGTVLDTARFRIEISKKLKVSVDNVHALVLGEHGDSEFPIYSNASISVKPLTKYISEKKLQKIFLKVKNSAYEIIQKKEATYYGIGMALAFIIEAILDDKRIILSVSSNINSAFYGLTDIFISLPALISKKGREKIIEIELSEKEKKALKKSADFLKESLSKLKN